MSIAYITLEVDDETGKLEVAVSGNENTTALTIANDIMKIVAKRQGENFIKTEEYSVN